MVFFSGGQSLVGSLYVPEGSGAGRDLPAIVAGPGWGGTRHGSVTELMKRLVRAGFVSLCIDYRGYGESDGIGTRLYPQEQAEDLRNAVAYLRGYQGVDPTRVAVLGLLTGAAAALQAASEDTHIRAVVALFPFGSGERWLRSLRRHWEWLEMVRTVEASRITLARTGEGALVDPSFILVRDQEGVRLEAARRQESLTRAGWRLGLDSVDAICSFSPEDSVYRISPRAVLAVAIEGDSMVSLEEVHKLYSAMREPKRLMVLPWARHHDIYKPDHLDRVTDAIGDFLMEVM